MCVFRRRYLVDPPSTDVLSSPRLSRQVLDGLYNLRGVASPTVAAVVQIRALVEETDESRGLLYYVLQPGPVGDVDVGVGVVESRAIVPVGFAAILQG